jgi:hypothetical protein
VSDVCNAVNMERGKNDGQIQVQGYNARFDVAEVCGGVATTTVLRGPDQWVGRTIACNWTGLKRSMFIGGIQSRGEMINAQVENCNEAAFRISFSRTQVANLSQECRAPATW